MRCVLRPTALLLPILLGLVVALVVAPAPGRADEPGHRPGRPEGATAGAAPVLPNARRRRVLADLQARTAEARCAALRELSRLLPGDERIGVEALPRLKAVLRLRGPAERALVMALLLRIPDDEAVTLWLDALDPQVERHEAVLAAATAATRETPGDAELARRLLRALRDKRASPARRALLLEALGGMDGPLVDLVLRRPSADETWVEASARALALGRRRTVRSVEPLLTLLEHDALAPRIHAWESLVALTFQQLPVEAAAWRSWWQAQDQTRLPERPRVDASAEKAGKAALDRYTARTPVHVPHYYGIPIPRPRSRVVFCLDASQSMYGQGIDQARRELTRTLMDLPSTHAFEIIVFNEKVMPWARRLVRAHPVQKFLAIEHLAAVEPTSYTNLYDSVETAFGHAGRGKRAVPRPGPLHAVFLLSDGAPNRGRYRMEKRVVQHIAALSQKTIPVHTIGAGEEVFPLLRAIARETGGTFVDAFE